MILGFALLVALNLVTFIVLFTLPCRECRRWP